MTVARLHTELGAQELVHWMALERLEGPFGNIADDIRFATLIATVINATRIGSDKKPVTATDTLPLLPWIKLPKEGASQPAPNKEQVAANVIALMDRLTHRKH